MKNPKRVQRARFLALFFVIAALSMIGWTVLRQDPVADAGLSRDAQPSAKRVHTRPSSQATQAHKPDSDRPEDPPSPVATSEPAADMLPPSQVADRGFHEADLDALALRLPQEQFAVYERMREEFPNVDWTEIEPTHQAFLDKRSLFPLNLNDEQREAYAAWLGSAGPVSEALVRLRAEELGLSATGVEEGRGYYIDGFRDGVPVYVITSNVGAAETTGVKFVRMNPGFDPALGDTVNGGELYVNINDHGTIYEHTEFQLPNLGGSRILYKEVNDAGSRDHMTHVAGTVAAWGYNSGLQGMAPRAWIRSFIQQSTWDITTYGMATPGQQMAEANPRTGRQQLRSVAGNTSLGTSTPYNRYDSSSASYDSVMRDYPYYMHFNSSGNSGSGYETLTGGWKIAKNMISLGNASGVSRNADGAYTGGGDISSSSSRGPTYDGRINPDFAAKGSSVNSTTGETGSAYYSGTSMASPNATGSVTLLMDYVRQRLPQQYLRSSTYRALLAITADDRGNPGPDYIYGWGILNMHAAAKIVRQQAENTSQRLILEESLAPNQTWREPYDSDGTRPIRVSIAWLDPAGAASADGDRSSRLVNDLDLRLIGPGGTEYKPYVMPFTTGQGSTPAFDGSLYGANAVQGDNITDPIEQVYIAAPTAGAYIVQVKHKGTLKDNQAQPFSVAVSGLSTSSGVVPASPVAFAEVVTQNGLLSPGEDVAATLSLINHSKTTANNVVARITSSDPDLTIVSDTVSYGNLATGQSSNGNGVLRIRLAAGASPRVVPLTLTVTTSSTGGPWVYPVTCAFVNPTAISGYVKTALGSPIAGATVSWTGTRSGKVTSGANGYYAIPEIDGTYQVTAAATGYISRPAVSLTVPPYRTQDLLLDFYDLAVSPTTLSLQAAGGQSVTTPLRLTNTGSLPVNWSIANNAYRFTTSAQAGGPAYVWNDISTTGTLVTGVADDTSHGPFPLGFTIPFYGQNFTEIRVCSNGWLSFTSTATTYSTGALPNSSMPENLIAPLMRDLKLTTAGTVHYQQTDADTFVVQFTNAPRYSNAASLCTFQVVLKRDGTITFYYQRADDPTTGLVGVQNAAKTAGLTVVHNQALIQPNMAIRIQPAWLSVSPASGTVAVGAVTNVTVTGNATGLSDGTYQANLVVNSNDSNSPAQNVPVSLVVSNSPVLVTVWPTASSIVQGQPLSASTLSGGSTTVPGTFAFNSPSTVLAVGTHSVPVTFTPTDTATYAPVQGSVSVTVTPANVAPVANAQSVSTPQGTAKAITLTGSDANGDPLTYAIVSQPTRGTLSGTPPNVTYTPSAGYSGSDSFTFKVNDGKVDSAPATVSITVTPVNAAPVANAQSVSTPQGTAKAITLTGSDANGDPLTYAIVSQPANGALSGTPPNVTYTPSASFSGSDSFTFKVNDGKVDSAPATVSITVTPVNTAPVAIAQSVSVQQATPRAITLSGSDANGDPLTYAIVSHPANGALSGTPPNVIYTPSASYSGSDSFTFKVNDGKVDSAPATVSITVLSSIQTIWSQNFDASVTGWTTTSSVGSNSWRLSTAASHTPSTSYFAPSPAARSATYLTSPAVTIPADATNLKLSFWHSYSLENPKEGGVLEFSVGGGAWFDVVSTGSGASFGSNGYNVTITDGGSASKANPLRNRPGWSGNSGGFVETVVNLTDTAKFAGKNLRMRWALGTNATGTSPGWYVDSCKLQAGIPVANTPPVAIAQSVSTPQGTAKAITLAGNDAEGDPLTYTIVSQPANGTLGGTPPNVTYAPAAGFSGNDSFTFKVNDGKADSPAATVAINVTSSLTGSIAITCDNGYELYLNGALVGTGSNWQSAGQYANLPFVAGPNVIAVKGTDAGGIAALLAELVVDGQRSGTSSAWKVSLSAPANWKDASFDDSGWVAANDYGAYGVSPWNKSASGMPADTPARWIWSSNNDADNTVYFRHVVNVGPVDTIIPTYTTRADGKTVATFTSGSGTWTVPQGVTSMEVLVVGGGGGGAGYNKNWGGGGAGGFIQSLGHAVTPGSPMTVSIGTGGMGGSPTADNATDGSQSRFGQFIAYGGLAGRATGGDSGGSSADGGATVTPGYVGGITGGSGAGAGQNGANNWYSGAQGGNGRQSSIANGTTAVYYGGGGGLTYGSALGGLGGGGNGSTGAANGSPGVNGLGGGGGASRQATGGNGGSGIVIVAYQVSSSQSTVQDPAVEPAPAEPFETWAACFEEGFSGCPDADDDGDGMNNFHEFAFGLDPTSENSANPIVSGIDIATHSFRYTRSATSGLTYTVWTSTDLVKWDGPAEVEEKLGLPDANGVVTVEATLKSPPKGGNLFVRVKAD